MYKICLYQTHYKYIYYIIYIIIVYFYNFYLYIYFKKYFYFLVLGFFGHACRVQNFLEQGTNQCHSSDNASSLITRLPGYSCSVIVISSVFVFCFLFFLIWIVFSNSWVNQVYNTRSLTH